MVVVGMWKVVGEAEVRLESAALLKCRWKLGLMAGVVVLDLVRFERYMIVDERVCRLVVSLSYLVIDPVAVAAVGKL